MKYVPPFSLIDAGTVLTATGAQSLPTDTFKGDDQRNDGGLRVFYDISNVTGTTPSLTLNFYCPINGKNFALTSTSAFTSATRGSIVIPNCPRDVLVTWTISGTTPSFTAEVWASRF